MIELTDPHGDKWAARVRRDHERHAGIPDFGYCPLGGPRPTVREITSADLRAQRATFGASRDPDRLYRDAGRAVR